MQALKDLLSYDPETGIFTWKARASIRMAHDRVGARAGSVGPSGYRYIKFEGKLIREHVLAHEFMYGPVQSGMEIDHINGDRADNRIVNLRLATHQQNLANCKNRKNNTSGRKGVNRHVDGRWRAKIMVSGRTLHLGLFETIEEASAAYFHAAKQHFGEFARAE
jgi:hypothetical protein